MTLLAFLPSDSIIGESLINTQSVAKSPLVRAYWLAIVCRLRFSCLSTHTVPVSRYNRHSIRVFWSHRDQAEILYFKSIVLPEGTSSSHIIYNHCYCDIFLSFSLDPTYDQPCKVKNVDRRTKIRGVLLSPELNKYEVWQCDKDSARKIFFHFFQYVYQSCIRAPSPNTQVKLWAKQKDEVSISPDDIRCSVTNKVWNPKSTGSSNFLREVLLAHFDPIPNSQQYR